MKEKMVCPFKKTLIRTVERGIGSVKLQEYFRKCEGKKCMAYRSSTFGLYRPSCVRLERQEKYK